MIKVRPGQGVVGTKAPTPMGIPPGGMSMSRFGVRGAPELGICRPLYGARVCRPACPPVGDRHPYGWPYTPPCPCAPGSSLASRFARALHTPLPTQRQTPHNLCYAVCSNRAYRYNQAHGKPLSAGLEIALNGGSPQIVLVAVFPSKLARVRYCLASRKGAVCGSSCFGSSSWHVVWVQHLWMQV